MVPPSGHGVEPERAAERGEPVSHALQARARPRSRGAKPIAVVGDDELQAAAGTGQGHAESSGERAVAEHRQSGNCSPHESHCGSGRRELHVASRILTWRFTAASAAAHMQPHVARPSVTSMTRTRARHWAYAAATAGMTANALFIAF